MVALLLEESDKASNEKPVDASCLSGPSAPNEKPPPAGLSVLTFVSKKNPSPD